MFLLPVQSGSDLLLKRMHREYVIEEVSSFLDELHRVSPETRLHTHILVGYPGESDEDFSSTVRFLEQHPYVRYSAYAYSELAGTTSAAVHPKISPEVISMRLNRLPVDTRL